MACRRRENGRAEKGRHCRAPANAAPTPRQNANRRLRPPQAAAPAQWPVPPPPSAARRSAPRRLRTSACASRQAASHAPAAAVHAARIRLGELAEVRNMAVLGWREYWGHLGAVTRPPGAERLKLNASSCTIFLNTLHMVPLKKKHYTLYTNLRFPNSCHFWPLYLFQNICHFTIFEIHFPILPL